MTESSLTASTDTAQAPEPQAVSLLLSLPNETLTTHKEIYIEEQASIDTAQVQAPQSVSQLSSLPNETFIKHKEIIIKQQEPEPQSVSLLSSLPNQTFITHKEIITKQQNVLFEILDSGDMNYFLSLCELVPNDVLVKARDKRLGYEGKTILHSLARSSFPSMNVLRYMISLGADVNAYDTSKILRTPIMDAVSINSMDKIVYLIESGADIFLKDINGENILHIASRTGLAMVTRKIITTSIASIGLSERRIQELASVMNINRKLPEDLAANDVTKNLLINLRISGTLPLKRKHHKRREHK